MWELLQERLERPTYAPDRLGYGFSDAPPWALSLEQYAQSTVDTLNAAFCGSVAALQCTMACLPGGVAPCRGEQVK
jgi:pimeloyl-ACP methyl ester carboxylesterase